MVNEVQLKTIQDCQARIAELKKPENGGVDGNKAEIEKLNQMISDAISGKAKENDGKVVEDSTIDIRKEMSATFSAKVKVADEEKTEATKQYSGKAADKKTANENIKEEFGARDEEGSLISKDDAKARIKELDKEKKAKEKELKQAEKDWKKAMKSSDRAAAREAKAKYEELSREYQGFKSEYDKEVAALRVNAEKKGATKGIRKAADHNVKNYDNVNEVAEKKVFASKAEEKAYLAEHPGEKDNTVHLSNDEYRALQLIQDYGAEQIDKAQKAYDENPGPETEKALKAAQNQYGHYADMIDEKGNIDTKAAQNVLIDYAGGDQNLNLDEKRLLKKELNVGNSKLVSQSDIKSLYKKFGFGTESATGQKLKAAGIAAATVGAAQAVSALLTPTSAHASATDTAYDSQTVTAEGESKTQGFRIENPDGSVYKGAITAAGGSATAFAEATATAIAEAGVSLGLGAFVAAPVVAGLTAFIMTKGKTEDAFDGASVEAVLQDLSKVKNADNQAIINKIQDLDVPNEVKAAVLKASMGEGVKANTEELLSAYNDLVKTKELMGKITVEDAEEPEPIPPEPEPEPIVDDEPEDRCTHQEERSSHSDVIPSAQVKGHGQSPYWIAKGYVTQDGQELTKAQRDELQKLLSKEENRQVQETGNFNGSKIGFRYKNEITLKDGTVVKLADDAAKRIGTGEMSDTRVRVVNGKQIIEERTVYCDDGKPVEGPEGQWHKKES